MDGWTLSSDTTPVFDRNRHLVGTLAGDDPDGPHDPAPGGHGNPVVVELTARTQKRLGTDRPTIEIPASEVEAIRREGIRLGTTIRGLRSIPS